MGTKDWKGTRNHERRSVRVWGFLMKFLDRLIVFQWDILRNTIQDAFMWIHVKPILDTIITQLYS